MKLTQKQRDQLWGERGPYSEAWLILETRILDVSVTRIFINVEVHINPYTYRLIKQNRKLFINDPMIQQLLNHSEFRGQPDGYVSCAYQHEYRNEDIMKEAQEHLAYAKSTIIKMHKFVLNTLGPAVK